MLGHKCICFVWEQINVWHHVTVSVLLEIFFVFAINLQWYRETSGIDNIKDERNTQASTSVWMSFKHKSMLVYSLTKFFVNSYFLLISQAKKK